MDELLARHKKEQRELQGKVVQKKKNATKKTRKGVNDECDSLERQMRDRHQTEIAALRPDDLEEEMGQLDLEHESQGQEGTLIDSNAGTNVTSEEGANCEPEEIEFIPQPKTKKPNRQKARLARRAAEHEAQAAAAKEEAADLPDLREQEMASMKKQLEKRELLETVIQPDGHCLYSACAHSLAHAEIRDFRSNVKPYQKVRFATAEFMTHHPDDFAAFMEEPLESYVKKIKDTAEWGGQLELQAIARSYNIEINVLQADGRVEKFEPREDHEDRKPIWLAYYRHSFGLGEHYNALRKDES